MLKKRDIYLGLCAKIDELSKPTALSDAYNFYTAYVKAAKDPVRIESP